MLHDAGGFSHNQFALTIVNVLEVRHTHAPGLNLSYEVLQGQSARIDKDQPHADRLLEVQLVDASDSTTYDAHDTDDAIKLGLVTLEQMATIPLIRDCMEHTDRYFTNLTEKQRRKAVVYRLIDRQVNDMLHYCSAQLQQRDFRSYREAMESDFRIGPSPELAEQKSELEAFLFQSVYRHPEIVCVREEAQARLRAMYEGLLDTPSKMTKKFQDRGKIVGIRRAIVEFIAGMTDHYCEQFFQDQLANRS